MDKNKLMNLTDLSFPISIIEHFKDNYGTIFYEHLHKNHLQLFLFKRGCATIYCDKRNFNVKPGDILLINVNELHYGESNSSELEYFVFRIDMNLLSTFNIPACNEKYIEMIKNNLVLFNNQIKDKNIELMLDNCILEYRNKMIGYELKLLSNTFEILSQLFRMHIRKEYSCKEADILMKKTKRFEKVFLYIDKNYNSTIILEKLCEITNLSSGYFCRLFKQTTGKTPVEYVNRVRIEKAVMLLNQGSCNVTEAAMSVGFDDINYFCRVFKKYMKQSPKMYLKNSGRYLL